MFSSFLFCLLNVHVKILDAPSFPKGNKRTTLLGKLTFTEPCQSDLSVRELRGRMGTNEWLF